MKNTIKEFYLPNLERTIPLTLQNLALQAFPDGSIAVIESEEGWCVTLAKENLSAVLVTDRKAMKFYASLDTAIRQLEKLGVGAMLVKPLRGKQ